jgi:hypothetical protein
VSDPFNFYDSFGGYSAYGIASNASNVVDGDNSEYTLDDFKSEYPQFASIVPDTFLTMYLNLAHVSLKEARWKDTWHLAMGLFIAHFATLYLQSMAAASSAAAKVINAGQAKGLTTSKSVGDVSKSADYNSIGQDLEGWAAWTLTAFGQQLATFGKLIGKGGIGIW